MIPDETICYCRKVTKTTILEAVRNGARDLQALQLATGAGTGNRCAELHPLGRCCSVDLLAILKVETGAGPRSSCGCCRGGKG